MDMTARSMPDVMDLLQARIPLTLLIDLADERGPRSEQLLRETAAAPRDWHARCQSAY